MAREIMHITGHLDLYSIRYKALIHLIQEILLQPPHPWLVSEETIPSVFEYNVERMEAHYQTLTELLDLSEVPSTSYHHLKEFFQHASAAILTRYGGFLGVGDHYGLLELNRTLALIYNDINLWHYWAPRRIYICRS